MSFRQHEQTAQRASLRLAICAVVAVSFIITTGARAARASSDDPAPRVDDSLPAYTFPYKNGLYATIAGYLAIKDVEPRNWKKIDLKIDGFKNRETVRAVIQNKPAPLVVVLLGIDGKADGRLGRLWPAWLEKEGYNVLSFDSTFLPSFIGISGHGVTGNLVVEAERVSQIINAFLKSSEAKGKITSVGIAGMSYGGVQALLLGEMQKDGKLPFKIDAIQAFSPPIKLQKTGELIDKWFDEDRWNYTLADLSSELSSHKPVSGESTVPFSDTIMRAGISALFRIGLADVIVKNDNDYRLKLLPEGNVFDDQYIKQEYAETWGYAKFMDDMCFPYWQKKQNLHEIKDLTDRIELCKLMAKQPPSSEVILAADDPFNTTEDFEEFKNCAGKLHVTILPNGGHLGFAADPWTKAKLFSMFGDVEKHASNRN
jgi:predicted alpha/beta-fold hydrolase